MTAAVSSNNARGATGKRSLSNVVVILPSGAVSSVRGACYSSPYSWFNGRAFPMVAGSMFEGAKYRKLL